MDALNGALIAAGDAYKNHVDPMVVIPDKLKLVELVLRWYCRGPVPWRLTKLALAVTQKVQFELSKIWELGNKLKASAHPRL